MNDTNTAKVHFRAVTIHNEDGSYKLDENERRDFQIIYKSEEIQKTLRGI